MNAQRFLVPVLGLLLTAGTAVASPGEYDRDDYYEHRGPMPFEVLDLDGDGVVSAEEHAQVRRERQASRAQAGYPMRNMGRAPAFEQIDTNGDGAISRDELAATRARQAQQRMQRFGDR